MECFTEVFPALLEWETLLSCAIVILNPVFWNGISRLEYRTHFLSKTVGGPKRGITLLATGILSLNYLRTVVFHKVIENHNTCAPLDNPLLEIFGYLLISIGALFVLSSTYQLGFFCSFMGDYFGILLDERVTGFPFNVFDNPMYVGSVLVYLGFSFQHASMVGFLLTGLIGLSYAVALQFEQPFTARIYASRNNKKDY